MSELKFFGIQWRGQYVVAYLQRSVFVVTSRLEQGTLTKGDEVVFLPTHTASNACAGKVFSIEMHHKEHEKAGPGDNVGVSMKGLPKNNMPRDGDVMVKKSDTATLVRSWEPL